MRCKVRLHQRCFGKLFYPIRELPKEVYLDKAKDKDKNFLERPWGRVYT